MIKVSGIVVRGESKGKALGFPTANLKLKKDLKGGVYAGEIFLDGKKYKAGLFVHRKILEAHILNFSGDLYGKEIEVEIGEKIREIKKFKSDEELKGQIEEDLEIISRLTQINTRNDADAKNQDFLYENVTYKIRGACFEVYKQFGGAFKEKIIENAFIEELKSKDLKVETQKRIDIYYKDKKVGVYVPDIIVNDSILIELKSKPFLTKEDERQFWLYLKGSNYRLGLLINFGTQKLEIKRRIYDLAREKSA